MNKKNILMVSHDYFPNIGGIAVYTHELSKALKKKGNDVSILTYYYAPDKKVLLEYIDGIRVYRIPILKIKKIEDWQYQKRMSRFINEFQEKEKVDVVHWQTLNKDAKMMKKVNVKGVEIYTNHLSWFRMLYNKHQFKKIKSLIGNPNYIICPSNETKDMTEKLYGKSKCQFIPNGVDNSGLHVNEGKKRQIKKELGIGLRDKVLITTNRMEPIKGMEYFIKSIPTILENYADVSICIVGDGSQEKQLRQWLENQSINSKKIFFLGRKTNNEVKQLVSSSDIYIQPSLMEGCSIAIIEAMACGKPVIACDIGGNPDIVDHNKTGILIKEKDSQAIFEAVHYLVDNPKIAKFMGEKGLHKVESSLTWEVIAEKVDDVYDFNLSIKDEI